MSDKPVVLPRFDDPGVDVGPERLQAMSIAHQLLTEASRALASGKPPRYPPLPRLHPEFDAVVAAALAVMARSATPTRGGKP